MYPGMPGLAGFPGMAGMARGMDANMPVNDTSEQIQISSLALLKMLKHGNLLGLIGSY